MKIQSFLVAIFAVVMTAVVATNFAYDQARDDQHVLIDQTLPSLKQSAVVSVTTSVTQMHPEGSMIGSMTIASTSATCITCGGPDVTATTGLQVGDGCMMGQALAMDVAQAWCIAGSTVAGVRVVYGER